MGIHGFFPWHIKNNPKDISKLKKGQDLNTLKINIDNFFIDVNGLLHSSAQSVFKYGSNKPNKSLLGKNINKIIKSSSKKNQKKVFEHICQTIENLLSIVKPNKRLILCVDGPAPLSKQNQQRQRRFKAALERSSEDPDTFDSNCLTPGTKFMDSITKYIDWYVRTNINTNPIWKSLEVVFSSEKVPGEGEHKLINYMRSYGNKSESYCINGLDADLIMLALGTHLPNFWIIREDLYNGVDEFYVLNIGDTRKTLSDRMNWEKDTDKKEYSPFNKVYAINDFIFMFFLVGNDFLPNVPCMEIDETCIDYMINIYKRVGESYGHLTVNSSDSIIFQKIPVQVFFGTMSQYDKPLLENKLVRKKHYKDVLLEKNSKFDSVTKNFELDLEGYRKDYYTNKFEDKTNVKELCHQYLEGLQWVLSYYTKGVPDWKWLFKHHYAPFAVDLSRYMSDFMHKPLGESIPSTPFQQLLSVLPPKSAGLIPIPLSQLLTDSKSDIKKYCPDTFEIDLSGKTRPWQGIVLLPMVNFESVNKEYFKHIDKVSEPDKARNIVGETFVYSFDPKVESFTYFSEYGNIINCKIKITKIHL